MDRFAIAVTYIFVVVVVVTFFFLMYVPGGNWGGGIEKLRQILTFGLLCFSSKHILETEDKRKQWPS